MTTTVDRLIYCKSFIETAQRAYKDGVERLICTRKIEISCSDVSVHVVKFLHQSRLAIDRAQDNSDSRVALEAELRSMMLISVPLTLA